MVSAFIFYTYLEEKKVFLWNSEMQIYGGPIDKDHKRLIAFPRGISIVQEE